MNHALNMIVVHSNFTSVEYEATPANLEIQTRVLGHLHPTASSEEFQKFTFPNTSKEGENSVS